MKAYEATLAKVGREDATRTILVGGNSLKAAAVKADLEAADHAEEVVKLEVTEKVIL